VQELAFWKAVIGDKSGSLETTFAVLRELLVSLDLDVVVAQEHVELAKTVVAQHCADCKLRVQIQTDPRYAAFLDHARPRDVLGLTLPVASLEDILPGKIWAALGPQRRPSKRRKDLLDIERIVEAYPALRARVPAEILDRLEMG